MGNGGVTVFGGTGFLGRRIVERLSIEGVRVRVAVRHTAEARWPQKSDIEVVYADVRDRTTVAQAVQGLQRCRQRRRALRRAWQGDPSKRCMSTGHGKSRKQ